MRTPRASLCLRFLVLPLALAVAPACQDDVPGSAEAAGSGEWAQVPATSLIPVEVGDGNSALSVPRIPLERAFISIDSTFLGSVSSMVWWDELLVVVDHLAPDPVQIWNSATLVREATLGGRGSGPGEFVIPILWDQAGDGPPTIWDFSERRLTPLEMEGEVVTLGETRRLDLPVSLLEFATHGQSVWASGLSEDFTVLALSPSLEPSRRIVLPLPHEVPSRTGRMLANRSFLAISPQGNQIVIAYQFANRLDLIDLDADSALTFPGPIPTATRYSVSDGRFFWEEGNEIAYLGVQHSGDRIYASFCGCELDRDPIDLPTSLHVFGPDGEAMAILEIGLRFTAFAVDPGQTRIALVVEDPYPRLLMMELPQSFVWQNGRGRSHQDLPEHLSPPTLAAPHPTSDHSRTDPSGNP